MRFPLELHQKQGELPRLGQLLPLAEPQEFLPVLLMLYLHNCFFFVLEDVKNFIIYNRSIIILSYATYFFTFRKTKANLIEIDND